MHDDLQQQLSTVDVDWLRRAIEISRTSVVTGGSPFGAVVAQESRLLAEGGNQTAPTGLPIRHAEVVAIEGALQSRNGQPLESATLYSSCAPCIMCLGTAFYAGIRRVIYSLKIADVVPLGSGDPPVEPEYINETLGLGFQLYGEVLHSEALAVVDTVYRERGWL